MKKMVISLLIAVVLIAGLVTPVFAGQGDCPNGNWWGKMVSGAAQDGGNGDHASNDHQGKKDADPPPWGAGGIRCWHWQPPVVF